MVAEERAATISREAEQMQAALEDRNRTLVRRTAHETLKPDYHTVLPDAGRLLYNAACCGAAPLEPDAAVPTPDAPG